MVIKGEGFTMAKIRKSSDKKMVKIYAEAYYQAMKRYNAEIEAKEKEKNHNDESVWDGILFGLNILLFPWKINKKFKINNKIYDSILVLIITMMFTISGTFLWVAGMYMVITTIVQVFQGDISTASMSTNFAMSTLLISTGSVLIISGNEFSKVTDSNKIYAYSASILAAVSCMLAIISLVV